MNVLEVAKLAKKTTHDLLAITEDQRMRALRLIASELRSHAGSILDANKIDLKLAVENKLSPAMIDRLTLSEKAIEALAAMCLSVGHQPAVVGEITDLVTRSNGLTIQKQRIPIGVLAMIFESRPNVLVDAAALAIKSGNAIILKGGKEAYHSNRCLFNVINNAIKDIMPLGCLALLETRDDVGELLKLNQYIDLVVPRGGSALVEYVKKNATMPVVAHDKGLCHLYVHFDAEVDKVIPIILNAKNQRPGVCNALESLILHEKYPHNEEILMALTNSGVEVRGCHMAQALSKKVKLATEEDYQTEYLDKIISVKIVKDEDEAIGRIQTYSSHHTEAILAQDTKTIELFLNSLDASCIVVNASTRFNDGGELGLGAELGISTSKLHAYGPMGAREMTTTRFLIKGSGQIR